MKRNKNPDFGTFTLGNSRYKIPAKEGVYLVKGIWGDPDPQEIDVYMHDKEAMLFLR